MMICSWVKIISLLYHVFCCPIANSVLLGLHFFFRKSRICGKELALSSLFFSAATSTGVMCFILSFQARFASTFACCSIFRFLRLSSLINPLINSACGGPKNSLRCFQNGVCELCENMFISSIRVQVHCKEHKKCTVTNFIHICWKNVTQTLSSPPFFQKIWSSLINSAMGP